MWVYSVRGKGNRYGMCRDSKWSFLNGIHKIYVQFSMLATSSTLFQHLIVFSTCLRNVQQMDWYFTTVSHQTIVSFNYYLSTRVSWCNTMRIYIKYFESLHIWMDVVHVCHVQCIAHHVQLLFGHRANNNGKCPTRRTTFTIRIFYYYCMHWCVLMSCEYWNGTPNHVVNMQIVLKLYLHILYFDPKRKKQKRRK